MVCENRIEKIAPEKQIWTWLEQQGIHEEETETIDLQGAWIYPGFHDSHMHLLLYGQALASANLGGCPSMQELQQRLHDHLQAHPQTKVLHGMGWNQEELLEKRMPERCDLDAVSREIPIVTERCCTHILTANSAAMKAAGIYKEDGIFLEEECTPLTSLLAADEESQIEQAVSACVQKGLTCVQSADLKAYNYQRLLPIFEKASKILRIHHQVQITDPAIMHAFTEEFARHENTRHTFSAFKGFADGALGGRTAFLKEAYADDPGSRGIVSMSEQEMDGFVKAAKAMKRQVLFHAIGDGAIEQVLNVYEKYQDADNTGRYGILHVQITDDSLLERFEKQKILALVQPVFWKSDASIAESRVGKARAKTSYAFGRLSRASLASLSTDCPIEDCDPIENMHWALQIPDALTLEEAIAGYSEASAYAAGKEKELGRLEEGFLADLVVLDGEIHEKSHPDVVMTMVDGQVVYQKDALGKTL